MTDVDMDLILMEFSFTTKLQQFVSRVYSQGSGLNNLSIQLIVSVQWRRHKPMKNFRHIRESNSST